MRVLAVDTATFMGTVAVLDDGRLLGETSASVRAAHGETLLPHVERTLAMSGVELSQIDLLAVGLGPGSFTGVRIGVATMKGFALATGAPIVGVDTLEVMAAGCFSPLALRVSVVDAYKGEVYVAAHEVQADGRCRALLEPSNLLPSDAAAQVAEALGERPAAFFGDGLERYPDLLVSAPLAGRAVRAPRSCDAPRAAVLAELGRHAFESRGPDDLVTLEPRYVRASDAKLPKKAQQPR